MTKLALIDTSYLYALYNRRDRNHKAALAFSQSTDFMPVILDVILPEVTFLFLRDVGYGGVVRFLKSLTKTGLSLTPIMNDDVKRASEIMGMYQSAEFDLVDAVIMSVAERVKISQICIFDRRDFAIYRPDHVDYFTLLP